MNDSSPSLLSRIETSDLLLTALALAAAAATALGATWPDPRFPLLAILVLVIVCREMLVEAARDLFAGRMSMELSMIIAIAAAGLIGEWTTSLVIAAFVVAAEILEDLAMDRGRDALTELMSFLPATARVRRGDGVSEIPTAELSVGDLVLVSPGEGVPVDGIVRSGSSTLDESRITGVLGRIDGHEILAERAPAGETASTPTATRIAVLLDSERIASIDLVDEIRPSAAEALAELRRRGYSTVMLTGDSPATARAVGEAVGVERIEAGLLPEDKQRIISELRSTGAQVAMVGDGVNDAPALALAKVGIAMGSGTDIARESGDVILVGSDLHELVSALGVARRARRIILVNFIGTILVDLVGMALAAFGLLTPIGAALIHVGSESAFILNSARLVPAPRGRGRGSRA